MKMEPAQVVLVERRGAGVQSVRKGLYVDKSGLISFVNHRLGTKNKLI